MSEDRDVHTEHCCIKHGCKYGKPDECTVCNGTKAQSYPCEYCREDEGDNAFKTLIEEQAARIEELEQKLRTTSLEALAISDTNNELQARISGLEDVLEEKRENINSLRARLSKAFITTLGGEK